VTTHTPDVERAQAAEAVLGQVLRRARLHQGLTLRDVERRTGILNAHLSQIERGVIRKPDPAIVFELATAYHLDFALLAEWAGYLEHRTESAGMLHTLIQMFLELDPVRQAEILTYAEDLRLRT
jgi:transcriptional regulator with XRE-family HTH domain